MQIAPAVPEPTRKSSDPHAPRSHGPELEPLEAFAGAWRISGRNAPAAPAAPADPARR